MNAELRLPERRLTENLHFVNELITGIAQGLKPTACGKTAFFANVTTAGAEARLILKDLRHGSSRALIQSKC